MVSQPGLFDRAPSLNVLREMKAAMAAAADGCGLSREVLCERMNELADRYGVRLVKGTGQRLTMATLEKWLNPEDKERVIPAKGLPVFCAATGNVAPLQVLVTPIGGRLIDGEDVKLLEWAKAYHATRALKKRMRRIEEELG
ncbi:MAG: hypothetical protein RBU24_07270 [Kiritimatiellia bacterium]|jgi:hypothetical protein|nr:hypothetical protein [Kiritimatiellia bacterium]